MTVQFKYENKECALEAVTKNGFDLAHCSLELKNTEQIVMAAVKTCDWAFQYASDELKSNKKFIMKALNEGVEPFGLISYTTKDVQSDIEVMSLALEKSIYGIEFKYAQGESAINKELAAKALVKWFKIPGNSSSELLWKKLHPTLKEFFPQESWHEKAQSYLYQLEQEKQAELVSGGSTTEDDVVW